jgi:hypothetical protein
VFCGQETDIRLRNIRIRTLGADARPVAPKPEPADTAAAEAMDSIDALVRAWDFGGAAAALAKVEPKTPLVAARIDEVARLAALQKKMIARIDEGAPRLRKSSIRIPGANGDLVEADAKGITATVGDDDKEVHAWKDLSPNSARALALYSIDRASADDMLAVALLSAALGDIGSAERDMAKAESLGAKVEAHLDSLAAGAFEEAKALIEKKDFTAAAKALEAFDAKYGKTAWAAANAAVTAPLRAALAEDRAETIYAQAVPLLAEKRLFELKPLVDKLRKDYAKTRPVTDGTRTPSFAQMAEAVAKLGNVLVVRQDGTGDATTLGAALKAAEPQGLIEIADSGVYRERIEIADTLEGLTLRGRRNCWPIITSLGAEGGGEPLIRVDAKDVSVEHLIVSDLSPAGTAPCMSVPDKLGFRGHALIVYGDIRGHGRKKPNRPPKLTNCVVIGRVLVDQGLELTDCLVPVGNTWTGYGRLTFRNSVVRDVSGGHHGTCDIQSCTVPGRVKAGEASTSPFIGNSIVGEVLDPKPTNGTRVIHSNIFGKKPFHGHAKPGKGCFSKDPQFRNPAVFDFRLRPTSPCIGKASDGSDMGCRYTAEMLDMLKLTHELRKRGVLKF